MTNAEISLEEVLKHKEELSTWEKKFIETLVGYGENMKRKISGKQYTILRDLEIKFTSLA
jgi:hypothetical protein